MRHLITQFSAALFALVCLCGGAAAQDFPQHAITLVVPVPAGSGSDVVARIVAHGMSERLGQSVVVKNEDGGNGIIAAEQVAHSRPDGYTLLVTAGGQAILPSTEPHLPFNVVSDFTPVALLTSGPILLVASANFPAKTVPEFIAYAKAHPKTVTFGNTGTATVPTLAMYMLAIPNGMQMVPVGYRGGAPAMIDVAAGYINLYFSSFSAAVPFIKSGKVKVLGISSASVPAFVKAIPEVAGVTPIAEQGVKGFDVGLTYGAFAPAKTPQAVIAKLDSAISMVMRAPETVTILNQNGIDARYLNSADYARFFRSEIDLWAKVVKSEDAAK